MYKDFLKPIGDFIIALILFLLFIPVLIIISLILFFTNHGKIFFLQPRPGLRNKIFFIIKFKTMLDLYDSNDVLLPDEFRVTKIGNFIRATSIDELLQLLNVLKGDMSLVGPRPLLVKYISLYNKSQANRHNVKPGITGWAQINGRNNISWKEKFEYDLEYVQNQSFLLDIKILYKTFINVLLRKGINADDHITMKEFSGNE